MTIPIRSDIRTSLERLVESGLTNDERRLRAKAAGAKMAGYGVLVVDLRDPTLTQSQHDRAAVLLRELHPSTSSTRGKTE